MERTESLTLALTGSPGTSSTMTSSRNPSSSDSGEQVGIIND